LGKQASFELQEAPAAYGSLSNVAVCAMRSTAREMVVSLRGGRMRKMQAFIAQLVLYSL